MSTIAYWKFLQKNAAKISNVNIKTLYMKDGLLAVYKPYGIPVHSGPKVKFSVADFFPALEQKHGLPSGSLELANRIDKNVAGVLLLTYKREMAAHIAHLQRQRKIEKEYLTIILGNVIKVYGTLKGDIVSNNGQDRHQQTVKHDQVTLDSAETEYRILDNNKLTCMLCSFETKSGYKHQIRVHASELMKCPILGDHKYHNGPKGPQPLPLRMMQLLGMQGVKQKSSDKGKIRPWQRALVPLHLFAREVRIPDLNNKKEFSIIADIPEYFQKSMTDCDLLLDRHEVEANMPVKPNPFPLLKDSILRSKGVSPRHVEKESSF